MGSMAHVTNTLSVPEPPKTSSGAEASEEAPLAEGDSPGAVSAEAEAEAGRRK